MSEVNKNILSQVNNNHKQLLSAGIVVLQSNIVINNYEDKKNEWLEKIKENNIVEKNSMHKITYVNPMSTSDLEMIVHFCWYFAREHYNLFNYGEPYIYNSFAVKYSANKHEQQNLPLHIDDSLITINMCLSNNSHFGNVVFCDNNNLNEIALYKSSENYLVIHRGNQPHYVTNIRFGERISIIIWVKANPN